jgi:hypothetical protein
VAVFVLTSATIQVGTAWTGTAPGAAVAASGTINTPVDVSALVTSVELSINTDEIEFTNFASAGWRQKTPGLQMGSVALNFNDDYASSLTDQLFGLGGTVGIMSANSTSTYYMDIRPTSASRSATNPSYVLRFLNLGGSIVGGSVGTLAVKGLTFPTTGVVTRLTS